MKILKKIVTSKNRSSGYKPLWLYNTIDRLFVVSESKEEVNVFELNSFDIHLNKIYEYRLVDGFGFNNCDFLNDKFIFFSENYLNQFDKFGSNKSVDINYEDFKRVIYLPDQYLLLIQEEEGRFTYRLVSLRTNDIKWEFVVSERLTFLKCNIWNNYLIFNNTDLHFNKIQCINYHTGHLVWSVDITDWFPFQFDKKTTYKSQVRQLMIYKDLVLANMHGHVVAFEIETGEEVWRYSLDQSPIIVYQFILDEVDGLLWVISSVRKNQKGTLRQINAQTGEVLWASTHSWDTSHPETDYGDRWWWHFSMNKNFIFLTFESGFMGVMDKKTGVIVEWLKFTKRNGAVNHGHKLLNKTLYQPTDFEFLAIDVSEYFLDGDTMEVNSRDD